MTDQLIGRNCSQEPISNELLFRLSFAAGSHDGTRFILESLFQGIAKVLFQKRKENIKQ